MNMCAWITVNYLIKDAPNSKIQTISVSSCSCLCPIYWSQVLSREWRWSWNSADRRCSNYIWIINNFIAYEGASYIIGLISVKDFRIFPFLYIYISLLCVYVHLYIFLWYSSNIDFTICDHDGNTYFLLFISFRGRYFEKKWPLGGHVSPNFHF